MIKLSTDSLDVGIKDEILISNLNLSAIDGALVIVGPSGCGKSTLLKTLAGLKKSNHGRVVFDDDLNSAHLRSAYVWQELALMPWLRAFDTLKLALNIAYPRQDNKFKHEHIQRILSELGLLGIERRFPFELSGGQQQRLALAQALIGDPQVLFLDEPFSALDAMLREHLQDSLKNLLIKRACLMVMVTHDLQEAVYLGKNILLLGPQGSRIHELIENPAYKALASATIREDKDFQRMVAFLHQKMRTINTKFKPQA